MTGHAMKRICLAFAATICAFTAAAQAPANEPASIPYRFSSVRIVAGGFISGMVPHPTARNLMYLRTDIGGAYRSDDAGAHWTPLTDWVTGKESNLLGIESIAVDPTNPDKLYLAAGTYDRERSPNGAILRSNDRGRTFDTVPMPFKMGGNEDGRFAGERMAVDPNLPSTIYLGTRLDGLWKSLDSGAHWARVESFTAKNENRIGVVFVTLVRESGKSGSATRTLYAGVSSPADGLWRSTDAGVTWSPVPGAPSPLLPNHGQISGGDLYLTFGSAPGPNDMKDGAVWKLNLRSDKWTNITPEQPGGITFGYGGLALDAAHPGQLIVSTMDHWTGGGDNIYRTTNGGRSWNEIKANAVLDASLSPYLAGEDGRVGLGHWIGAMIIDPFNPRHALYGTGETVWASHDLDQADKARPTHWAVGAEGIEETAVITLVSPPAGPHLFSGLGDIGCFRNDDFDRSPPALSAPRSSNCTSLDYAATNPQLMVRAGGAWRGQSHGASSSDGGQTWTPFATEPANATRGGTIAISADGKVALWATGMGVVASSTDQGKSWKQLAGTPRRPQIVADLSKPESFFLYDAEAAKLFNVDGDGTDFKLYPLLTSVPKNGKLFKAPLSKGNIFSGGIWIGSRDGLWHMQQPVVEDEASRIKSVERTYALGFGKPQDNGLLTLFLSGVVAGQDGVFRSTDGGDSWQTISDPAHRYGYIGVLAGDPRVFGRVYLGTNGRGVIVADPAPPTTSASAENDSAKHPETPARTE